MINPQAFASGFKEACVRYGVSSEVLLKLAGPRDDDDDDSGAPKALHTAQRAANVALGAPVEPDNISLGEVISRLKTIGMYGAPGTMRQPFGS